MTKASRSKIQDPRSKVQDPRSKVQGPRSKESSLLFPYAILAAIKMLFAISINFRSPELLAVR